MNILVIDNYDSFTYNLVQYLAELGADIIIKRNDQVTVAEIVNLKPDAIVISPGPGRPENAGICPELIRGCYRQIPILGVCLGHQAIGLVFGGRIGYAPVLMHGKVSCIRHRGDGLFKNVPRRFTATRYHSLLVDRTALPRCLKILAETDDGLIMAFKHRRAPVYGVQFHPESILTLEGKTILGNFLELALRSRRSKKGT